MAAALAAALAAPGAAQAKKPVAKAVYAFTGQQDGMVPAGPMVMDSAGNLYATTTRNSSQSLAGTVVKLTPPARGATIWSATVIYTFTAAAGYFPLSGLIIDKSGNLYVAAEFGGAGGGSIFEFSPPATGGSAWTTTVLHRFSGADGDGPASTLTMDSAGNLYGTTVAGGSGNGNIFELSPPAQATGAWTETVLYTFPTSDGDGGTMIPNGVTVSPGGVLYGTTMGGVIANCDGGKIKSGCGSVFSVTPPAAAGGQWRYSTLYQFTGAADGTSPRYENLLLDRAGNVYGDTFGYKVPGRHPVYLPGSVFKLTPPATAGGAWGFSVLASFPGGKRANFGPQGTLTADAAGNLFGVTWGGASKADYGSVYELAAPTGSATSWTKTTLYAFTQTGGTGNLPFGNVILSAAGTLYGVTQLGGAGGDGVVFSLPK